MRSSRIELRRLNFVAGLETSAIRVAAGVSWTLAMATGLLLMTPLAWAADTAALEQPDDTGVVLGSDTFQPPFANPTPSHPVAEQLQQRKLDGLFEEFAPVLSGDQLPADQPVTAPVPTRPPQQERSRRTERDAGQIDVQPAPEPSMLLLTAFAGLIWLLFFRKSCRHATS